jgi:hypothetical protein
MIYVESATRAELEVEVLSNDELAAYLGGLDALDTMELDELREKITKWIAEGDELGNVGSAR